MYRTQHAAHAGLKSAIASMMSARAFSRSAHTSELHPFPALKILIVAKEVLDLITKDRSRSVSSPISS
jgi:hypothetical protein